MICRSKRGVTVVAGKRVGRMDAGAMILLPEYAGIGGGGEEEQHTKGCCCYFARTKEARGF